MKQRNKQNVNTKKKRKQLLIELEADLGKRLKIHCAKRDISMRGFILQAIVKMMKEDSGEQVSDVRIVGGEGKVSTAGGPANT